MDAIILAAGENVRLQAAGLAPGRKPLILRDGEVLIRRLCRQAREAEVGGLTVVDDIIIVCSPSNVEDIVFATKEFECMYVVQPQATGPQHALDLALRCSHPDEEMYVLLMGDNYIAGDLELDERRTISVIISKDSDLHPITLDGRFTDDDTTRRWLGPVTFFRGDWVPGMSTWVDGFYDVHFHLTHTDTEDMGTL